MGNIVNRVFDSSGPEGKVRGTPQQIIDKYLVLARDAQLSNDRVAAENFLQHAEHYTRMLSEAQREAREAEARRESQQGGQGRGKGQDDSQGGGGEDAQGGADTSAETAQSPQSGDSGPAEVIDLDGKGSDDSSLVETPETTASAAGGPDSAAQGPGAPAADTPSQDPNDEGAQDGGAKAGNTPARKSARAPTRRRSQAKPAKSEGEGGGGNPGSGDPKANSAAE